MGFDIKASFSSNDANLSAVKAAIEELKSRDVLVGIPEEKSSRSGESGNDKITNAELLFIHTNGSPARGIPARPVLEPAIEHSKERISAALEKAVDTAVSGNTAGVLPALEAAGMEGQSVAREWFTNPDNHWEPNSPDTIKRKKSSRPLIDTGEMRKSITYVVRKVK